MTEHEELQLQASYEDQRRYQDADIDLYDTKGEYSHSEEKPEPQ